MLKEGKCNNVSSNAEYQYREIVMNQIEILELKSTMTKMKSLLAGLNSRFELVEERFS